MATIHTLKIRTSRRTQLLDVTAQVAEAVRKSRVNSGICHVYVLVGASQTIFVEGGKLRLGRWQGIFFCEFDGPRERHLQLKIVPDATWSA